MRIWVLYFTRGTPSRYFGKKGEYFNRVRVNRLARYRLAQARAMRAKFGEYGGGPATVGTGGRGGRAGPRRRRFAARSKPRACADWRGYQKGGFQIIGAPMVFGASISGRCMRPKRIKRPH